jgi:hypothetical protein
MTPLIAAAEAGFGSVVELLLRGRADPSLRCGVSGVALG